MIDYQAVVDEIRYAIQSEDCELTDSLRLANEHYAEACKDINKRLRRVDELLNAGLRSEAIQFGEGPPNVCDVVAILSFPEAMEWSEIVMMYDMPPAERLNLEVVERLTEAQLIEQPLLKLLAKHRRLALARAPLKARLAVVRELYNEDPETYTWEEDVREYEKARLTEISGVARQAFQQKNRDTLEQILDELKANSWLENPPSRLIASVRKNLAEMSRKHARQEIEQVSVDLDSAFSELDLERAKVLRNRWMQLKKDADLAANDVLVQQLSPALGWIEDEEKREADEQRYAQSVSRLEQLLNENGSMEELESVEHEIQRLERSIPDLLATRLENRFSTLILAETRTHRLKLGAAIGTLLLLVGLVSVLAVRELRSNEIAALSAHIEELLNERQYAQAESALKSRSDVMRWESLLALQTRLSQELHQEQERVKRLEHLFDEIEKAESYHVAVENLEKAHKHVLTTDDEIKFDRLKGEWESRHHEAMMAQQRVVQAGIHEITTSLIEADQDVTNNAENPEFAKRLESLSKRLQLLQTQAVDLEPAIGNQIRLLQLRHKKLIEIREKRIDVITKQRAVTEHSLITNLSSDLNLDVKAFQDALIRFSKVLEDGPNTEALSDTTQSAPLWTAGLEWSKLTRSWNRIWPTASPQVQSRIKTCEEFLTRHPGSPDSKLIQGYVDQLKSIQSREATIGDPDPKLKEKLQLIFKTPIIADSWLLETKDGKRYYLPEKQKFSDKLFKFTHFVGYGTDELRECGDVRPDNLRTFETVRSPCSELANWASRELNHVDVTTWNQFCKELASRIIENDEMNPFLKFDLLRRVLESSGEGDSFLKVALNTHLKLLQDSRISPLARWMNPDDIEGKRATIASLGLLEQFKRLQPLDEIWMAAIDSQTTMTNRLKSEPVMVGWINKSGTDWTCETNWVEKGDWLLLVVFANQEQTTSEWREIGQAVDGKLSLKSTASSFISPGRPVFAMQRAPSSVVQE